MNRWDAILKRLPETSVIGAEIGVLEGENAFNLLKAKDNLTLYLVDIWKAWPSDSRYVRSQDYNALWPEEKWKEIYNKVVSVASTFGARAIIIRELSVEAAKRIENNFLDFVFIDAEHGYEACTEDIEAWYPKVKKGGWLCGHDWGDFWQIDKAVSDWANKHGYEIELDVDNTWFVKV